MDAREASRFLAHLYNVGEEFEVAFIHPGEARPARVLRYIEPIAGDETGRGDDATLIAEMERAEAAGYNVYTSVMPTSRHASKSYDRIWVDMDDPSAPWPFGADPNWEGPAWPKPTTLVKTSEEGGGFRWQAIWLLDRDIPEDDARSTMKKLAAKAGADGSVHDPRRVLRVPGIVNAKRGTKARLVETNPGTVGLGAFTLPEDNAVERLMTMQVSNPSAVLGEWLRGTTEGDRSRKAYVCARFLKSCDVAWEDAAAILKLGASRCEPAMDDRELEHSLNSAYHRVA